MGHVADQPWEGFQTTLLGMKVTLMSSGIAAMIVVAAVLTAVIITLSHRRQAIPSGGAGALEAVVVFVRDSIARPALHDRAYAFLPFLLTLFLFVFSLNIFGMIPLHSFTKWLGTVFPPMSGKIIGGTPTRIPTVCAGLASLTLFSIFACGLWRAAQRKRLNSTWPAWLCVALSPVLWLSEMTPDIPGPVGAVLAVPLAALELIGVLAKCFALMIRLAGNMIAGHVLLGVLLMFAMQAAGNAIRTHTLFFGVSILCVLGSAAVTMLDLLVACLQAYIFTFLTAMFLGLYVESAD